MCKEYVHTPTRKYDKSHLKWVEGKGYEGVVYDYQLHAPGSSKDGWHYIGCTPEEETRRKIWNRPKNSYSGKGIAQARKEFGPDKFDYHVLETHYNEDLEKLVNNLEEREKHFIEQYDAEVNGFNGNKGGTGRLGMKVSEEEIARRQASRGDFRHTEETKALLSIKGKDRVVKQETRDRISRGNKGKKRTEAQNQAQSARQKGKVPVAATAAAKQWVQQNGGGYWKNRTLPDEAKANMKKAQQERGTDCVATFPDSHEETFPTMLDAANATGLNVGSVKYSIDHNSTTRNGFKFRKQ